MDVSEPTFIITFDTELLWGIRFMGWSQTDEAAALRTRQTVMPAILEMLDEFEVPATFAVVGHLLVPPKEASYPDLPHHATEATAWYRGIAQDIARFPDGFLWPELPHLFQDVDTQHEIALHSFSHWHFEAAATTENIARFEITANQQCLQEAWTSPSGSLVFPRNQPGHLYTLREAGVRAFRGLDPNWYGSLPNKLSKLGHVIDCVAALPPPVSTSLALRQNVLDITGSYLLWSTEGFRRRIPQSCRIRQVRKGLATAVRKNGLFHLWMHPINLAHDPDLMLPTLRECLSVAASLRAEMGLRITTMSELTAICSDEQFVSGAR